MNKHSDTDASSPYIDGLESILDSTADSGDTSELSMFSNIDKLDIDEQIKLLSFREELKRFKENTKNRSILTIWTFCIISSWLIAVVVLLSCNFLSDSVAITLLSTTTINIIGLPAIVLRGYFTSDR